MKFELINQINNNFQPIEQILFNRGIKPQDMSHYLYPTQKDILDYNLLGINNLRRAARSLIQIISNNKACIIIVDCDCDGYTASAILINYLHKLFPAWVENNLSWYMHESKQHGLKDCLDYILQKEFDLVICPDASSNDYDEHYQLRKRDINCIVLDHHNAEYVDQEAIIINNQLSDYSNKDLSGAGIVYQFCRYIDTLLNVSQANNFLDLVALGNTADMMSLTSIETKYLINEGLLNKNIKNPFMYYMVQKNDYSLKYSEKGYLTSIGVAFYIAPFVNAITRSGTLQEKKLIFKSMLEFQAFKKLPSTKRGHAAGDQETVVEQAVRVVTNVKTRQGKAQDLGMQKLQRMIETQNLLQHKVLLFLIQPGEIDRNIAGLCANKIMAKYQRPTCVLTKYVDIKEDTESLPWEPVSDTAQEIVTYQGSARGYEKGGINDFRNICLMTNTVEYAEGHANAFGLSIVQDQIPNFIQQTDILLKDLSNEPIYYCDYIWESVEIKPYIIEELARWDTLWGKDVDEPLIGLNNVKILPEQVNIYRTRGNTIRINLGDLNLIKFFASEEQCEQLENINGWIIINIIGRADINKWQDNSEMC